jgi:pimeloyl-ACP methyl ester carboxylesterase
VQPETRYAHSGEVNIAYQVVGDGPLDLVFVPGFVSHLDLWWADPGITRFLEHLASFSRLIMFDKRGTGLSDPVMGVATLEERMDDVRAVMDAVGSERAAVLGLSEGGPMSILFAATYPERVSALVLCGTFPSGKIDPETNPVGQLWVDRIQSFLDNAQHWGDGTTIGMLAPSLVSERERRLFALFERAASSPAMVKAIFEMNAQIDVCEVLPTIRVPTLVLHRQDEYIPVEGARYIAQHIPGAKLVVLPGHDHIPWIGEAEGYVEEIEEFLTGARHAHEGERALATVLFTDIVDSTARAAELGDTRWRELLAQHDRLVRSQLERFRGREVKSMGDGFLATFDAPARAIRCAGAIVEQVREVDLDVRAGLHTGECELVGDDVGGMAVHIGARIGALAGPGEVLVSSTVRDLVAGSGIGFAERGLFELKGVPGEWRVLAVAGAARPDGARLRGDPEPQLRPSDRMAVSAARRAPRIAQAVVRRYRRGGHS